MHTLHTRLTMCTHYTHDSHMCTHYTHDSHMCTHYTHDSHMCTHYTHDSHMCTYYTHDSHMCTYCIHIAQIARIHIYTHTHMHMHMHTHTCTRMHTHPHIHTCTYTHAHTHAHNPHMHMHTCTHCPHTFPVAGNFPLTGFEDENVLALTSDPLDQYLIAGDTVGFISVFDIRHYGNCPTQDGVVPDPSWRWKAHDREVVSVDHVSQEVGQVILTASADCNVCLWTMEGTCVGRFGQVREGLMADADDKLDQCQFQAILSRMFRTAFGICSTFYKVKELI